jgi:hypothetical protein
MNRPVPGKAEVAVECPDKLYIGACTSTKRALR